MNAFECPFSIHSRKSPQDLALISSDESWTYGQCNQIIETLSANLKKEGVKPGDRVAFLPTATFPTPLLFFALFRLEAIACPLNTYFPLEQLSPTLDALTATYFLHPDNTSFPPIKQIPLSFSSLLKKTTPSSSPHFLSKDTLATYLSTSGSSSIPKIACHSIGNHYYSALGSNAHLPLQPGDRWLLSLPLYHVSGIAILFRCFLAGATVVLPSDKAHAPQTLIQTEATHLSFVPTQLHRLLEMASPLELITLERQLKGILLGGAAITPTLYHNAVHHGLPLFPSYGMTEMSSQICTQFDPGFSLGHPLPYREITLDADQEIHVRGKTLFQGYLSDNQTYDRPLDHQGYFATGDLGFYSPKQGLLIQGRKDRLFISGGENIQPEEIENHLRRIEGMINVRIEPIEDQEFGKRPVAYIQTDKPFRDEELKEYLGTFLPKFKIPVAFYPLKETSSFKTKTY